MRGRRAFRRKKEVFSELPHFSKLGIAGYRLEPELLPRFAKKTKIQKLSILEITEREPSCES